MKNQPLDWEYLTQVDDYAFSLAQEAVNFAVAVLTNADNVEELAIALLETYGDIHNLSDLPPLIQAQLLIRNYEVEEFEAMGEIGRVPQDVWNAYLENKGKP